MYKKTQFIGISLLLLFLFAMLSGIYQGKLNNFLIIFNIIGFYGAGLYFSRVKENLVIIKILLVSITIIFCFYFVNTIPQTHWVTHSQNHISVIIIFLTGMYYLNILNIGEKSLPIYPAIVAFSISVMAIGRSGILVSPLFFLGLILAHAKKGYIIKTIFLISFVLIVAWYLFESNNLYRYIIFNRFYDVGIDSEARTMIIDYWKNNVMYVKSFLFGVDLTSLKKIYQLSSHNSFISIHSRFGIGSIIIVPILSGLGTMKPELGQNGDWLRSHRRRRLSPFCPECNSGGKGGQARRRPSLRFGLCPSQSPFPCHLRHEQLGADLEAVGKLAEVLDSQRTLTLENFRAHGRVDLQQAGEIGSIHIVLC